MRAPALPGTSPRPARAASARSASRRPSATHGGRSQSRLQQDRAARLVISVCAARAACANPAAGQSGPPAAARPQLTDQGAVQVRRGGAARAPQRPVGAPGGGAGAAGSLHTHGGAAGGLRGPARRQNPRLRIFVGPGGARQPIQGAGCSPVQLGLQSRLHGCELDDQGRQSSKSEALGLAPPARMQRK